MDQMLPQSEPIRSLALHGGFGGGRRAGQSPLAPNPASFTLTHATPDSELFTVLKGIFKAVVPHDTAPADLFRFPS